MPTETLGLAFDGRNHLYVLESSYSTTDPGPVPETGRLIRILPNGKQEVLIDSTAFWSSRPASPLDPTALSTSRTLVTAPRSVRDRSSRSSS
jgi:hypothetical protein